MVERVVEDNAVRLFVYRFFVEHGRPPMPVETASALQVSSAEVEASLRRLADQHLLVLAPGTPYVWMANPLCALPSPFRVRARDRDWYGVCIWDALGVIAMLGSDGTVTTTCPDCAEPLVIDVRDDELYAPDDRCVVHYLVPAASWWDDIGFN
ncbi:MAG TPA: organomercurial lyase [Egibacteraceae bacterium]|nr:organomercurial lyase [Egibacteraceae bacterium]